MITKEDKGGQLREAAASEEMTTAPYFEEAEDHHDDNQVHGEMRRTLRTHLRL
jgi:hypothetical protein